MSRMERIEGFRRDLESGKICLGASVGFTDPLVSDALADSVDFLWIDLEHAAMSPEALSAHLLAARSRSTPAIVRVTGSATPFIKPVLDAGAEGIIVPQVLSVSEVKSIVSDCRYVPMGKRGFGPRVPGNYGRDAGPDYIREANESLFVAVMVETNEALEAVEDIVRIEGLDSLVIGPMDLSASQGMLGEVEHPRMLKAYERIIGAARGAGLFVGAGMGINLGLCRRMIDMGVQWIQLAGDSDYLIYAFDGLARTIRSGLADGRSPGGTEGGPL
ncbi:MAG TPA: aldolase/citrate lyase family protein [Spirochaetia bacterium]|nr:aldolase/citrate lyase family protein [Spirochaetia bacterium]